MRPWGDQALLIVEVFLTFLLLLLFFLHLQNILSVESTRGSVVLGFAWLTYLQIAVLLEVGFVVVFRFWPQLAGVLFEQNIQVLICIFVALDDVVDANIRLLHYLHHAIGDEHLVGRELGIMAGFIEHLFNVFVAS